MYELLYAWITERNQITRSSCMLVFSWCESLPITIYQHQQSKCSITTNNASNDNTEYTWASKLATIGESHTWKTRESVLKRCLSAKAYHIWKCFRQQLDLSCLFIPFWSSFIDENDSISRTTFQHDIIEKPCHVKCQGMPGRDDYR